MSRPPKTFLALVLSCIFSPCIGFAQGDLAPPGPPGRTMRTLTQVEPRIPISTLPVDIDAAGSYYVTTNLTGVAGHSGIRVLAGDVTLDLNGFTVQGVAGALHGIDLAEEIANVCVFNGTVRDWPESGIAAEHAFDCRFTNLRVIANGVGSSSVGMSLGTRAVVDDCLVQANANDGMRAEDGCIIRRCRVENHGGGGIVAGADAIIEECVLRNNPGHGMTCGSRARVVGCDVRGSSESGIRVHEHAVVVGNRCAGNHGTGDQLSAGILAQGEGNRIESNTALDNDIGLAIAGTTNRVSGNCVRLNGGNYSIAPGNQLDLLLGELPETLDWPCAVTLSGTLSLGLTGVHGITVNADDVTIDLAGHSLVGPGAGSGDGIHQDSRWRNLTVRNGTVSRWAETGAAGVAAGECAIIEDVHASECYEGIHMGRAAIVSGCTASGNQYGIRADHWAGGGVTVRGCSAFSNEYSGVLVRDDALVEGCALYENGSGAAGNTNCVFRGCTVYRNGIGIGSRQGSAVRDCDLHHNEGNGIHIFGDDVTNAGIVSGCTVSFNGDHGIAAGAVLVTDCEATHNGASGIATGKGAQVVRCSAYGNGDRGIYCEEQATIMDCAVRCNTNSGILARDDSNVEGCVSRDNGSHGVWVFQRCSVTRCTVNGNGGDGIHLMGSDSRIDGNAVRDNATGIYVHESNYQHNVIVRNIARGNATNYDVPPSPSVNYVGALQSSPVGAGAWDNLDL